MNQVKKMTEEAGQKHTVYTSDQQLYKISVQNTWFNQKEFENFIPRLGGMHMLMSFVGSVGTLMANTGLEEAMSKTFGGVKKMLLGKKFPQNVRALRLVVEELLQHIISNTSEESDHNDLPAILETIFEAKHKQ